MSALESFKILEPQKRMMVTAGMWPEKNETFEKILRESITYFLAFALTASMLVQLYDCYDDFTKLIEILYITLTMVACSIKIVAFRRNQKYFFKLTDCIEDPRFHSPSVTNRKPLETAWKVSFYLSTIYKYVCLCTCVTFAIFPFLENEPLPVPFPYFHTGKPRYFMFTFQIMGLVIGAWSNGVLDLILAGLLLVAGAHLDLLKIELSETLNNFDNNTAATATKLKSCYIKHLQIIEFIKNVEHLFSIGLLAQIFASIVVLCNTGFHLMLIEVLSIQFLTLVLYLIAMMSELLMYCWFGNEIIIKSLSIGDVCYNTQWYKLPPNLNKYLFLIMERTKKPLFISAYKFSYLSVPTLMSILHWTYSYYALLRRLYQEKN